MAKKKIVIEGTVEQLTGVMDRATKRMKAKAENRNYEITQATIKDDFCNYSYEINKGVGIGDTHNVKGRGIIKEDLKDAFSKFNVHLAVIDDVFKHSNQEIESIESIVGDELTVLYSVTGFKVAGSEENESVVLIGNKYISGGGRIELETPKISLDNMSSYKWYNELKEAVDTAKLEVALYKEGKCTPVKSEEEENPTQGKLYDNKEDPKGDDPAPGVITEDVNFEGAEL